MPDGVWWFGIYLNSNDIGSAMKHKVEIIVLRKMMGGKMEKYFAWVEQRDEDILQKFQAAKLNLNHFNLNFLKSLKKFFLQR